MCDSLHGAVNVCINCSFFTFSHLCATGRRLITVMPILHRRHGQDKTVLSCVVCVGGVNRIGDKTRQFCLVSAQFPISMFSVSSLYLRLNSCNLETGSRQDKTVLSCHVSIILFASPTPTRQDKTVLSCPCRRCEIGIRHRRLEGHCQTVPPKGDWRQCTEVNTRC